MARKRRKKPTLRLKIDRVFAEARELQDVFAFQNPPASVQKMLSDTSMEYIYTKKPKREFVFNNTLIEKGFKIYYRLTKDKYELFKPIIFKHLKKDCFVSFNRYKNSEENIESGFITLTNFKKREKKNSGGL